MPSTLLWPTPIARYVRYRTRDQTTPNRHLGARYLATQSGDFYVRWRTGLDLT